MTEHDLLFELQCLSRSKARKQFRRDIFAAWGCCAYCNKIDPRTLDHVVPKSRGGLTVRANLIPSCGDCNLSKSNESWDIWYRSQKFWSLENELKILEWVNHDHAASQSAKYYEELCQQPLLAATREPEHTQEDIK